ncbi:MAG: histone deacetylase [Chloroflexi bacterium]|nr:histone deacetylase [Chloroflexota bacterium]
MKVFYHDLFTFPLPEKHRFPVEKYARLREAILAEQIVPPENLRVSDPATDVQLSLAHDRDYIDKMKHGRLGENEIRKIGFPWSPQLVERARRSVGSTISACRAAFVDGIAVNLAGGTHHAFRDRGEGFCIFNDAVVAARLMQSEGRAKQIVILDCDVHQGNGTANILANDSTIFTFSIHGANNYPFVKEESDLDIPLPDGVGDEEYLAALSEGLNDPIKTTDADLVIYLAGADAFVDDRLGRLSLTKEGLATRDEIVLSHCRAAGLPVAIVMGGGYAPEIQDIVDIHLNTVRIATAMYEKVKY